MTELPPDANPVDGLAAGSRIREWQVVRFVARGAFGQVFEARRDSWVEDEPNRALKVFDPILSSAARSALLNEFNVLRTMRHPNLLAGEDAFDLNDGSLAGSVIFVMELADTDLATVVARQGPAEPAEVATIGADVARGLAALHEAGQLHGDVKPENVLVAGGTWKLGDFGVSSSLQGSYAHPGGATLDFRPPEVTETTTAARVHRSADIWALGVTLWMAGEGAHPFMGADSQLRYAAALRGHRRPTHAIDPRLAAFIDNRCLTADPHLRATATELAVGLDELACVLASEPRRVRRGTDTPPEHPPSTPLESAPPTIAGPELRAPESAQPSAEPTLPVDPAGRPQPVEAPHRPTVADVATQAYPDAPVPAPAFPHATTEVTPPDGVPGEPATSTRPLWVGAAVGGATAAVTVEVASVVAAAAPGGLAARRATYAVLVVIAAVVVLAVDRRWSRPRRRATQAALVAAALVVAVATAGLFIGVR